MEQLNANVKPVQAEERLRSLITTMGDEELRMWEADLRLTIGRFLKKRRKALSLELNQRLDGPEAMPEPLGPPPVDSLPAADLDALSADFTDELRDLSERHIYEWSTSYRDVLSVYFDHFCEADMAAPEGVDVLSVMHEPLAVHSEEIGRKGFLYLTQEKGESPQYAVTKSLNGLQRFLDLPIEFFTTKAVTVNQDDARTLRDLCSGMLRAILGGYARVQFGHLSGGQILPRHPRFWAHSLAFLTDADLELLLSVFEPGEFRDGVTLAVRPVAQALDDLCTSVRDYVPLTALAQLNWEVHRLEISIRPPPYASEPKLIEIQSYIYGSSVSRGNLEEAAVRTVDVIVAPLRPDLHSLVNQSERLHSIVVPAAEAEEEVGPTGQRVLSALESAVYKRRSPRGGAQPLQYNFAREFPLHDPFLARYHHVRRSSVRELLRAFEQRNGVRLWCSIRRSGKTTACLDLSTTDRAAVVIQTCETTGRIPEGSIFYDSVCRSIADGRQLPPTYFPEIVKETAAESSSRAGRIVFVLDEYETLFGRLNSAVSREEDLRYTVAQPLLNQMVEFSRENLLVFLGQQPNAHYILMDQNQLSAYVQQDSFPLFQHEAGTVQGELSELIRKVLTERVSVDPSFVDEVHSETAGHPYLTVNLLVEFVDWLIEKQRPVSSLSLDAVDFEKFVKAKLRPKDVSLSPEYHFFRETIGEALGAQARATTPWLHAIYTAIRGIVKESPTTLRCTRSDFDEIVEGAHLPELGMDGNLLLSTGSQANFVDHDEHDVWPKIRLLARLAKVTRGRVSA